MLFANIYNKIRNYIIMADNQEQNNAQMEADKVNNTEETQVQADEQAAQEAEQSQTEGTNEASTDNSEDTSAEEKDPLTEAQEQIAALKDQLLRTVAEFENYKKRTAREKADLILNGGSRTVTAILPVLDDFERALADKSEDPEAIKEGNKMIFNKFTKALESLGVKQIETKDKDFDTDYHEAVAMVPGLGDDKKGKVIDCLQTGYVMNDKVIRHAKVAVAQ